MEIISEDQFFCIQESFEYVPYPQTVEWSKATACVGKEIFFVNSVSDPKICCFGQEYSKKGLGKKLVINGDTYSSDISSAKIRDFYADIIGLGYDAVELSNLSVYNAHYEIGVRQAGFLRPLRIPLSPMTILVDVANMNPSRIWKRNVKKSADALSFSVISNPDLSQLNIFCKLFEELKEIKGLSFSLSSESLLKLFEKGRYLLFFASDKSGKELAGRIVYVMGDKAYDIYAANSHEARKCNASYFIMQSIFDWLAENGVKEFDFGRIPPCKGELNTVYEFKSFSGGTPVAYNGQWTFYKNRKKEWLIFTLNYIVKKLNRY